MTNRAPEMTAEHLLEYKNDAIKILETQIDMLSNIESDILHNENSTQNNKESKGILNIEKCNEFKEILKGEIHKLQSFDVVLAVVGTMKAGKSTTINAIVGREILPNRNRPMTSLPTLICHNKNQVKPKITFNAKPINDFLSSVNEALKSYEIEKPTSEISHLINFIQDGKNFKNQYEGETHIFDFLQLLNDLVRLTAILNEIAEKAVLKFPYDSYKNIDALPIIEVAFKLEESFETKGRFMLLDTAGPNEAGHKELLDLLREQLQRSSAVMLVLDYSQLNSEAEDSIKNELEDIPSIQKSRLFALVNKFDQKSANSDDAEATKNHIFNNLLKDKIEFKHIYPVSSQRAYLANRMFSSLSNDENKPDYKAGSWVADFASRAYGEDAEEDYEEASMKKLHKSAEKMLERSSISSPLSEVILNMQKNAPYIALQSALSGSSEVFEKLHNFFNIRGHFANREKMNADEIAALDKTIENLRNQIGTLQSMSAQIRSSFDDAKKNTFEELEKKEKKREIHENIKKTLDEIFDNHQDSLETSSKRNRSPFLKLLLTDLKDLVKSSDEKLSRAKSNAKSNKETLIFSNKTDFDQFQEAVQESIDIIIQGINSQYSEILDRSIEDTKKVTGKLYSQCNDTLVNIQDEFNKEGIKEIKIESVTKRILRNENNVRKKMSLGEQFSKRRRTVHQSGVIGKTKRLFGGLFKKDWGTYEIEETSYTIRKKDVVKNINNLLVQDVVAPLKTQISKALDDLLQQNLESIEDFNTTIENIVAEMNNAISQEKIPELEAKKEYKNKIKQLQKVSDETEENWESLASKFGVEKINSKKDSLAA